MANNQEDNAELNNDGENNSQDDVTVETSDVPGDVTIEMSEEDKNNLIQESFESDETVPEEETVVEEIPETVEMKREVRTTPANAKAAASGGGSTALPKILMLFGIIIAIGAGLVYWKNVFVGHHEEDLTKITKEEMGLLVKDFNPMQRKQLSENPIQKEKLITDISQLLAIASQAQKDGFFEKPEIASELKDVEKSIFAISYDRKINAGKGPMPPFGYISEDRVKEFWGEGKNLSGLSWIWNGAESRRREAEFKAFIQPKIENARKSGQLPKDREPSEAELKQAKDAFAKTQIYYKEAKDKLASLSSLSEEEQKDWKEWKEKTELQIKLQKAQFIAGKYSQEVLSKKAEVTDEDVQKYLADHPELGSSEEKLKKAEEILQKVKDGGDFAKLAEEFSEDPGSKNKGGFYKGISKGQFAPEFEAAALALEAGEVAKNVVKTNFGYHIIKLEKKGEAKGANGKTVPTYDVRHILISTMVKDPNNPAAREMPADQLAKTKLQKEKQQKVMDEIKANNPIEIATDFEIPQVSEEEIKKMQEDQQKRMEQLQQQQKQGQPKGPKPPAAPPKPQPKKK